MVVEQTAVTEAKLDTDYLKIGQFMVYLRSVSFTRVSRPSIFLILLKDRSSHSKFVR